MSRFMIASEENLACLAHYGVKGMKWRKKSGMLDKIYQNSAERSKGKHFKASSLFNMDEKTKKNFFREYKGTTVEGDTYEYNPFTGKFTVYPKQSAPKSMSKEDMEAYKKDVKDTEKRFKKKYNQKIQKIQVYY